MIRTLKNLIGAAAVAGLLAASLAAWRSTSRPAEPAALLRCADAVVSWRRRPRRES